jgi:hypothetical protein
MAALQKKLDELIESAWRDTGIYVSIDRETAIEIINTIEQTMEFGSVEFEWDALRGLIDYYSDAEHGGDGKILVYAETGRRLSRAGSGDKSGVSILGTALRAKALDPSRTKPALFLLEQVGGKELGWTAHHFWWPIFAAPANAAPCVFATKTAA